MNNYNKKTIALVFKILSVVTIVAIVISILYLLLLAARRGSNTTTNSEREQPHMSNQPMVNQSKVIEKIEAYDIQQSLGMAYDIVIKENITIDDWFIIVIESKNQETDPGLLIYKKTGDSDGAKLIIGPGTLFSRQQMLHREIPENIINNPIVQTFIGGSEVGYD